MKLANSLDKDTVLVEGYKQFKTDRQYLALMGDWRLNKDEEVELDGIGGVSILVKADVHRSGIFVDGAEDGSDSMLIAERRYQFSLLRIREPG